MNNRTGNIILVIVFNVVATCLLLETVAVAYYYYRNGELYYTREQTRQNLTKNDPKANLTEVRIHPFLGFIDRPDLERGINNYGFKTPHDYPYRKTDPAELIVGVFGGSVAHNFVMHDNVNGLLSRNLKNIPKYADRTIVVLPFAQGGHKQPQQLAILTFFLSLGQEFDLVVNVDGFNEVALSELNRKDRVDIAMPASQIIMSLINLVTDNLTGEQFDTLHRIQTNKARSFDLFIDADRSRLAITHLVIRRYARYLRQLYFQEQQRYEEIKATQTNGQDAWVFVNRSEIVLNQEETFSQIGLLWARSSLLMHDVLTTRKIPYFHFIQPNQYFPAGHTFSAAEQTIAHNANSPYIEGVQKGYPALQKSMSLLREKGVEIHDATDVFDTVTEPVYRDDCCHYNELGKNIFTDRMSEAIAGAVSRDR